MLIRLFKILFFVPIFLLTPVEAVFWGIRWILTGKSFPNSPLYIRMFNK